MQFATTILAALGLTTSLASAHIVMGSPVPYGKSTLNNSPLAADGSDFPCKQREGVYKPEGADNTMPLGSVQPLSFIGSAVHGGGSCQISITYDEAPTKLSVFKVIHSIEGGCPAQGVEGNAGNDPNAVGNSKYSFTVPADLATGKATLAWTWFNKIGNREMYMNCAPVTLTGGSAKRSARLQGRQQAAFEKLPDMFTANFPAAQCATVEAADLEFPDPGVSVEQLGAATAKMAPPTGAGCGAKAAPSGSSGVSSGNAGSGSGSGADSSAASSATTAAPVASAAPASEPGQASPSAGAFVTVSSDSGSPSAAASSTSTAAALPTADSSFSSNTTGTASSGPSSASTAGSPIPTVGALAGACDKEGEWNCIDGAAYQQCASARWSPTQAMAAGTECNAGEGTTFAVSRKASKRSPRGASWV